MLPRHLWEVIRLRISEPLDRKKRWYQANGCVGLA